LRSPRGALLVSRTRQQPVDVRVLTEDGSNMPVLLSQPRLALEEASLPLEACGTRTAPRFPIVNQEAVVDGERSQLVNLSVSGAQVVLPARVQPQQTIRLVLTDDAGPAKFRGRIAWASMELGPSSVRYRAGIAFSDPDTNFLEHFCHRHGVQGAPDTY
jgi:hypothetical protein